MSSVLIGLVGDVLVNRDNPREVFNKVREVLKVPQIMFANLEAAYTDHPHPVPSAPAVVWAPSRNLDIYAEAGFNVMSMANNHILDAGYEAMLETGLRLRNQGVKTCGAGKCAAEAREPAIMAVNDLRVAFLAYSCVFSLGV